MKTVINKISDKAYEKITIDCCEVTQEIINLRNHAESVGGSICGITDGKSVILPLSDILYFEAVDEKVFAYTESDVADVRGRLYEYEDRLSDKTEVHEQGVDGTVGREDILRHTHNNDHTQKVGEIRDRLYGSLKAAVADFIEQDSQKNG